MDDVLLPTALTVDLDRNTIDITVGPGDGVWPATPECHLLEMGGRGRLLGIELDGSYLMVCPPSEEDTSLARTVDAEVTVQRDPVNAIRRVSVPRRGTGYEISFPSGNQ